MPRTRTDVGKLALVPNDEMCLRWSECVAGEYGGGLERSVCPRTAPRSAVHGIRLYETCDVAHGAWHSAQRDRRPVRSQADFDKFSRAARAGKFLIKFSKILTWANLSVWEWRGEDARPNSDTTWLGRMHARTDKQLQIRVHEPVRYNSVPIPLNTPPDTSSIARVASLSRYAT